MAAHQLDHITCDRFGGVADTPHAISPWTGPDSTDSTAAEQEMETTWVAAGAAVPPLFGVCTDIHTDTDTEYTDVHTRCCLATWHSASCVSVSSQPASLPAVAQHNPISRLSTLPSLSPVVLFLFIIFSFFFQPQSNHPSDGSPPPFLPSSPNLSSLRQIGSEPFRHGSDKKRKKPKKDNRVAR